MAIIDISHSLLGLVVKVQFDLVDQPQFVDALIIEAQPSGVDPRILSGQQIAHQRLNTRRFDKGREFAPIIWDRILRSFERLKNLKTPHARIALIKREQQKIGLVCAIDRDHRFVSPPYAQFDIRRNERTGIEVVAAAIGLVRIVRQVIIFETVDPIIIVVVNPKEKLRPVHFKAQKRLFIIGEDISNRGIIVLVEIRDEIVVLVPTRKNQVVI